MQSTYYLGDYVASENSVFCTPRLWKPDGTKRGIIYCHGAAEAGWTVLGPSGTKNMEAALVRTLVDGYGFPLYSADLGLPGNGTTGAESWGNDNARTRVGQCRTRIQALGAKSGKVILLTLSMGTLVALRYAYANPTLVAAIVAVLPVVDTDEMRLLNFGGNVRPAVDAAYGVTYPTALPAGSNPYTLITGPISGVPIQFWYASDDAIASPSKAVTFGTTVGADMHNMGPGDHSDVSIGHVDPAAVYAWLNAQGAL